MPTTTTNYSLLKPLVADPVDEDLWGGYVNDDMDDIDSLLRVGIAYTVASSQTTGFTAAATISLKNFYPCDATGGAFAATLPTAASAGNGATVYFQKTDVSANAVTITRAGSDTIDGATTFVLSSQYSIAGLVSDGVSSWKKIANTDAVFTGDSGSGGTSGLVPAPSAGFGAQKRVLSAGGTWIRATSGNVTSAPQITSTAAYSAHTGSHTVPFDDSLPTTSNTELFLSATPAVTSVSASDFLIFTGMINYDTVTSGNILVAGIFRDAETTPIAVFAALDSSNNHIDSIAINVRLQAIDTSAHTYTVRAGTESGVAFYINGDNSGRKYGGALYTYLQVTPVAA